MRVGPHDISLFRIKHYSPGRHWFRAHRSSLLYEDLGDIDRNPRHFNLVIEGAHIRTIRDVT
jgi:hypothetical protein